MKVDWSETPLHQLTTEALIVPLLEDVSPARIRGFDPGLAELIVSLNHHGDFRGEVGEIAILYPHHDRHGDAFSGVKRLMLAGMGKKSDWEYERMRGACASAIREATRLRLGSVAILVPTTSTVATVRDLAAIVIMAVYTFTHYKTTGKDRDHTLTSVTFLGGIEESGGYAAAVAAGQAIGNAVNYVRDLVNHPSNMMTPRHLAADATELAGENVTVTVYGRRELEKMKMGALLAVAKGSTEEPQLIVVDYQPVNNMSKKEVPTVALVGKGITFDSGGISIKPSEGMEEMKMDMAGAATALGVIAAARALKLPVRIVAILPTTENLPSGHATKPGDIVTSCDGKTIEILNTDAEGRVVLADGLAYAAKEFKPDAIIDLATLTGAAIVALGHEAAPMMGNDDNLLKALKESSRRTGERVWEFPLWDEYKEVIKSEIADVKNLGDGRKAGPIAGAAFLSYFVPKGVPWAHIDIAGTAMLDKPRRPYLTKGGSGWGVRLLVDLLEHWQK